MPYIIKLFRFQQNQLVVEEEIKTLIADNQNLSKRLGLLLKEKLEYERQTNNNNSKQYQELDDMRKQVALLTKVKPPNISVIFSQFIHLTAITFF